VEAQTGIWRYENANRVALRDFRRRELDDQAEWCKERDKAKKYLFMNGLQFASLAEAKILRDEGR
jgi:hypothetical protein